MVYFGPRPIESASLDKMAFPLPDKPSIVVLPFDNMGGDPKEDYFSDGCYSYKRQQEFSFVTSACRVDLWGRS